MTKEQSIEQMHKAKIQRMDNSSLGAMVGGILHDAVALTIAKLSKEKESLATNDDYQKEISFWLDWLFKLSQDKKDYESIPVVDSADPNKQWDEHKQKIYEEDSELQEVKELNQ